MNCKTLFCSNFLYSLLRKYHLSVPLSNWKISLIYAILEQPSYFYSSKLQNNEVNWEEHFTLRHNYVVIILYHPTHLYQLQHLYVSFAIYFCCCFFLQINVVYTFGFACFTQYPVNWMSCDLMKQELFFLLTCCIASWIYKRYDSNKH